MKKFLFLPLILLNTFLFADMCQMTVIAESGLSIRAEPNLESKRLGVVKFGETVLAHGPCESLYESVLWGDFVEVDGIRGKWVKISFDGKRGYMFSGYLVIGDIFPYSRIDSIDNVIIDEIYEYDDDGGVTLDSFNYNFYSPNLNWYGIKINDTSTSIVATTVKPIYNNLRWLKENQGKHHVSLQVENDNQFDFLFGTRKKLETGEIKSEYHQSSSNRIGKFLYPEEKYTIDYNKRRYIFKAQENISISENSNQKIIRNYTINLHFWNEKVTIENKKNILNLYGDAEVNAAYQNPKLIWSGDLNRDGCLDFVFKVSPMADKCGAFDYPIFLSSNKLNKKVIYKSNMDAFSLDNFKRK